MKFRKKIRLKWAAILFLAISTATFAQEAQNDRSFITLDKVMTKDEQKDMGLAKLTPEERAKLELWLSNFALQAARIGAQQSKGTGVGVPRSGGLYAGVGGGHWVKSKIDEGAMIQLEDGSLWQISPVDKVNTVVWLTTDDITVKEGGSPTYPYTLIDASSKDSAEAKLISK